MKSYDTTIFSIAQKRSPAALVDPIQVIVYSIRHGAS